MKYKVSIGRNNKFYGLIREMFAEGEKVEFYVPFVTDVDTYVTSEDVRLETLPTECSERKYSFIMPAHDVKVEVSFRGGMTCMHQPQGMPLMGMMGMTCMQNMMNMQDVPQPPVQQFNKENSKFCKECGAINKKDAKFCGSCGARCD